MTWKNFVSILSFLYKILKQDVTAVITVLKACLTNRNFKYVLLQIAVVTEPSSLTNDFHLYKLFNCCRLLIKYDIDISSKYVHFLHETCGTKPLPLDGEMLKSLQGVWSFTKCPWRHWVRA